MLIESILVLLNLFLFLVGSAGAQSLDEKVIKENKEISLRIDELARSLDGLLSNRRAEGINKTSISLIGFVDSREGEVIDEKGHVQVNLRLPELEEKWKLRFSSYDQEDEFEGLARNRDGAGPRRQKFGTSLGLANNISNIKTLVRPRIELRDPLVSSFLLKFSSDLPLGPFHLKWVKKFFTHSIDGVGQAIQVDFDYRLTKKIIFRFFNEEQYLDRYNLMNVAQGPTLLYKFSRRLGLSKTLSFNSKNRNLLTNADRVSPLFQPYGASGYHLSSYNLIFSLSHKIYKNVFHYQISPRLDFRKQQNFKGQAGVTFRTELIF